MDEFTAESRIPADPHAGRFARIESLLETILEALQGSLKPGSPPGIRQRQDAQDAQLKDHEERITDLEEKADTGKTKALDRVWLLVVGAIQTAIGLVIGLAVNHGGKHP